jgi:predicted nucleic acid-binding protein
MSASHPVNPNRYMVDSNIFSDLVNRDLRRDELLPHGEFWATSVQVSELANTANSQIRAELLAMFQEIIGPKRQVPPAFAFGIPGAGFGEGDWRPDGTIWYLVKKDLDDEFDNRPNRKRQGRRKGNNALDASIAEAASHNNCILLTRDSALAAIAARHGVKVCHLKKGKK